MKSAYRIISVKDLVAKEKKAVGKELEYYILNMLSVSVNMADNMFLEMIVSSQIFGKALRCYVYTHTDTRHEYVMITNRNINYHILMRYTHHDYEAKSEFTYDSAVIEICDRYGQVSFVMSNQEPPEDYELMLQHYQLFVRDINRLMSIS